MLPATAPPTGGVGTEAPSKRPALRVTDIFRRHAEAFDRDHVLTPAQGKVLRAIASCRTADLGGHLEVCDACGYEHPVYNSCRDRHCPGCQAIAQFAWIDGRLARVLPTHHFHVVFTLPEEIRTLALQNGAVVYDILLKAASQVLATLADQRLGAQLGVTTVLHTWTRAMLFHPHVHCVVTGGGLTVDGSRWVATPSHFLFPVAVMRMLFRGIVRANLKRAHAAGRFALHGACADLAQPRAFARLLRSIHRKRWVVYSKPPFAGSRQVFAYLGRYTHRVAISDYRLVAVSDDAVTFSTKDGGCVTVTPEEFIRRFLLHVLPAGFHKIRHLGLYAGAHVRNRLERARAILPTEATGSLDSAPGGQDQDPSPDTPTHGDDATMEASLRICPRCRVGVLRRVSLQRLTDRLIPAPAPLDSS